MTLSPPAAGTDEDLSPEIEYPSRAGARELALMILARVGSAAVVLLLAITVTFVAVQLAPGDTVSLLLGENRDDADLRAQTIERWGLDQPLWSQYLTYLARIPSGDLGTSYNLRRPVAELLAESIGPTMQLALASTVVAILLAYLITIITTANVRFLRPVAEVIELILVSTPSFWIAIVLLALVSFRLGWFSIVDSTSWQALVLPTASLAIPIGAYLAQVLRDGVDRALEQPAAITARARGITPLQVRTTHALRHASLPVLNLVGLIFGSLLGGAVIVEQVFGRAGLGQIAVDAVTVKDIPLILGVALVSTFAFVVVSTLVDVLSLLIDPRLRTKVAS